MEFRRADEEPHILGAIRLEHVLEERDIREHACHGPKTIGHATPALIGVQVEAPLGKRVPGSLGDLDKVDEHCGVTRDSLDLEAMLRPRVRRRRGRAGSAG